MTPKKNRGIGAYLLVAVLLIMAVALIVPNLRGSDKTPEYSEIIQYFDSYDVKEYTLDLGSGELKLKLQDDTKVTYDVPNVRIFLDDTATYRKDYNEKHPDAPLVQDYYEAKDSSWILTLIPTLLLLVMGVLLFIFMMRQASGGGKYASFGKANIKNQANTRKATFADVAGADEEKHELEEIVDFLKDPKKYTDIGARIPKGVLLMGPPGTGKTLLARAVAGEAGCPFFSISGSDFVEMFVGVGASRVRDLFEQAKKNSPSIIFIDEIDAVGRHRGTGIGGGHDEREQTLNQLLVEMDGFTGKDNVIVIAATNRRDILDPALLRPGRFDRQVYVGAPDMKGREDILKVHARGKQFDPDVRFDSIAKSTAGFTGADLENLLNEAALLAARRNKRLISMEDIEDSFLKVIMGTEKKSRVMTDREKRLTAYHEAGHAIATRCLPTQDPVHTISIIPRGRAGGFTMSLPQEEKFYASKNEMLDDLIVLLGGRVAEKLTMDDISTGASNDIERATSVAKSMVTKYGMSDLIGPINYSSGQQEIFLGRDMVETDAISEDVAAKIDEEIRRIILEAYAKCEDILKEHMDQLSAVGEYLIRNETMDGDAFEKMFNGEEVPDHETGAQVFHIESGMAKTAKQDEENGTDAPQAADATVSLEEAAKKLFVDDKKDEEQSSEPEDEGE